MSLGTELLLILALVLASAFFSVAEMSLASARKLRLRQMVDDGDARAQRVLDLQDQPGHFFTVVQIGLNAVAILGGIVGESAFSPAFERLFALVAAPELARTLGFATSFLLVTSLFVLFADLIPKRLALAAPEAVAVRIITPMRLLVLLFMPLVWLFNGLSTLILKASGLPTRRNEEITTEDISAMVDAGTQAGVLHRQEQAVIENVFELESRTVPSAMTHRDSIVYLTLDEPEVDIKRKIAEQPHTKFPVCRDTVDEVVGYVDAKDLLRRALEGKPIALSEPGMVKTALFVPDTLSLAEVLEAFKRAREDFALILNEYALVVGLVTINDVMSTVMGELVQPQEDQIVQRDADSWLVDGITSINDVRRVLGIEEFPDQESYETLGGFLMYRLRKIPKRTDCVSWAGYKFEVVDIDNHKIDQVLVTRLPPEAVAG